MKHFLFFILVAVHVSGMNFIEAMGGEKLYWQYMQTKEDRFLSQNLQDHYLQQKQGDSIEKILHFVWLDDQKPSKVDKKIFFRWAKAHPSWKVYFWTNKKQFFLKNRNIQDRLIDKNFSPFYQRSTNWYEKENLLKYHLLYEIGGIVLSRHVIYQKPLEDLIKNKNFFCVIEPLDYHFSGSSILLSTQIIGAKKKHPIMQCCQNLIEKNWSYYALSFPEQDMESMEYKADFRTQRPFTLAYVEEKALCDWVFPSAYFYEGYARVPIFAKVPQNISKVRISDSYEMKTLKEVKKFNYRLRLFLFLNISFVLLAFGLLIINRKRSHK